MKINHPSAINDQLFPMECWGPGCMEGSTPPGMPHPPRKLISPDP